MDVTYRGGENFLINGPRPIAINPTGSVEDGALVLRTKRREAKRLTVSGPGEYEIGGIMITAIPAGDWTAPGMAFALDLEGTSVLVLTGPAGVLDVRALEAIGRVDVLIVDTADLPAAERLLRAVEPRVVLPFGPSAAGLCATAGVKDAAPTARFSWNGVSAVPKAILLKPNLKGRRAA